MLHRTTVLTVTALTAASLLAAPTATPTAGAAGETCRGRPATVVGTGPTVEGTVGDDVIVTGTSRVTYAGAGDDLVCVTTSSGYDVVVHAGAGDDVVDASAAATVQTGTQLGSGVDRFLGGPGADQVHAEGADDDLFGAGGYDSFLLHVASPVPAAWGRYDGGSGNDVIDVWSAALPLEVGLGQQVVVDGVPAADVIDFRRAGVVAPRAVVRGNAGANGLTVSGCHVEAHGGDGDDYMSASRDEESAPRFECERAARMSGGPGDDAIQGSDGPDLITGNGGDDELWGRAGADLLLGHRGDDRLVGDLGDDELRGHRGADLVHGSPGHDTLLGHGGRDAASGGTGRDRCVTEFTRRCEL